MNLFQAAIRRENPGRPPVWLMRQAGRYHSHYQNLKQRYSFMDLCRQPEIARETAMGPIRDFDFDAAILFSDLLFPLEVMGMGLKYTPGPELDWHLETRSDLARLQGGAKLAADLRFQGDALRLTREALPKEKGLLGFVGGPLTLFFYAASGSHKGDLSGARAGMHDGRFEGFCDKLVDLLAENMANQAENGADTIAMLDTCAGEVDLATFRHSVIPQLERVLDRFQKLAPNTPITYYSKGTTAEYWDLLRPLPISAIGVDWHPVMPDVIRGFADRFAIQGNFDPELMQNLAAAALEPRLRKFFEAMAALPSALLNGWICGLGHGVLQKTPETNVRLFVRLEREYFGQRGGMR